MKNDFEKKEFEIVCSIFKDGIESGELINLDPEWMADSFLTAKKRF